MSVRFFCRDSQFEVFQTEVEPGVAVVAAVGTAVAVVVADDSH